MKKIFASILIFSAAWSAIAAESNTSPFAEPNQNRKSARMARDEPTYPATEYDYCAQNSNGNVICCPLTGEEFEPFRWTGCYYKDIPLGTKPVTDLFQK